VALPVTTPPREVRRAILLAAAASVLGFLLLFTEGQPGRLFDDTGFFTSRFYDEQADAILEGRLDVEPEVANIEGILIDGKTYLYYGFLPALARLPVAATGDGLDGRLNGLSMLLALGVACWAAGRLAWFGRLAVRGPTTEVGRGDAVVVGAFVLVVGLSSPFVYLASRPLVYHEAELWGSAAALGTAVAALTWWYRPSVGRLAVAGAGLLAVLHVRGSLGLGAAVGLGLVLLAGRDRLGSRWLLRAGLTVGVPVASYAALNLVRFGSLFSIPLDKQLLTEVSPQRQAALAANDGSLFGVGYIPTTLWHYLRPDGVRLHRLFPWITFRDSATIIGRPTFDVLEPTASLPVTAPVLLVLAVAGLVVAARRRRWEWLAVGAGGLVGAAFVLGIGFIAHRYLSDFMPILVPLAALGIWWLADAARRRWHRRLAIGALVTAALVGSAANLALAIESQQLLLMASDQRRSEFVAFQYRNDPGDGPAGEVRLVEDQPGPVGARNDIAVVAGCEAVFWSDGSVWAPVELGPPARTLVEGVPDGGAVLIGSGWEVTAELDDDGGLQVTYREGTRTTRSDRHPVDRDRPVRLRIDRDRFRQIVTVSVDGDELLRVFVSDAGGRAVPAEGWEAQPVATPLCDELTPRATSRIG
jgi:hypothetical protein